ncbi:tyrosine-type recombinase/integrase, partial [Acinetobacter baumannii]
KGSPKVFTVSDSSRDALFRKARKKAGLENADLTFHDSRHEAASLMAKRIKNALTLCKIFGWKDPKQALTYYNPTNDEILDELNKSSGL